jgi:DNA-binding transcriptional LysR family regulator
MILLNRNLEAFLGVVDLKTVSSAAKKLHLTQTAVTQRIKALEAELNLSLFLRSKNGMKLTAEGEILFRSCIVILE